MSKAILIAIAIQLLQLFALFMFGSVIEAFGIADEKITAKNYWLNSLCTIFRIWSLLFIGGFLAAKIAQFALWVPFHGIVDFSRMADRGSSLRGMALALGWLAIRDFFYYWMHRAQHSSKWLWAIHELHHSDEHMHAFTSYRHHWLEAVLEAIFITLPIAILFRPPVITAVIAYTLVTFLGIFIHLNSTINLGPINRVLANPSTHRIHHSKRQEHLDKNFAAFFPIWDVIFGTYVEPVRGIHPETGLASGKTVNSPYEAFILPFSTWIGMPSHSRTIPIA